MTNINRALLFLSRVGGWTPQAEEQIFINAVLRHLGGREAEQVAKQLSSKPFIERTSNRIAIIRVNGTKCASRIQDPGFEDSLYKVRHQLEGKILTAHVTFYKGYIFSVELPKERSRYLNREITVISVIKGKEKDSFTIEIDKSEHG